MLPWQELTLKVAVTALVLAVVLPLAGFAFTRSGSGRCGHFAPAPSSSRAGAAAGVTALLGEIWR